MLFKQANPGWTDFNSSGLNLLWEDKLNTPPDTNLHPNVYVVIVCVCVFESMPLSHHFLAFPLLSVDPIIHGCREETVKQSQVEGKGVFQLKCKENNST